MALVILLTLLAAPAAWLRTELPHERIETLAIVALEHEPPQDWPEGLAMAGLWQLASPDPFFGGYSALLLRGGEQALAFSDGGDWLAFTLPGHGPPAPKLGTVPVHPNMAGYRPDIESVAQDATTGAYWLGYEQTHAIRYFGPGPRDGEFVRPRQMRDWPRNSGIEALVRLADGRFLALGERNNRGLLFAGDPVAGAAVMEFAVKWPTGERPVGAALLPDGRVLILTRRLVPAWPIFRSTLMIGDPREIGREQPWRPELFARLDDALPSENHEAIAVSTHGGNSFDIWLMSDNNFSILQRTLLVRLRWRS